MNTAGGPPFFNTVQPPPTQMQTGFQQPPSSFYPNLAQPPPPAPNFSVPVPNMSVPPPPALTGNPFPRFSGPMHNQPTFHPAAMAMTAGTSTNIPPPQPPLPSMNLPPPVYNLNNNNSSNSNIMNPQLQQGTANFTQTAGGKWANYIANTNNKNSNNNTGQLPFPSNQQQQQPQRQMPNYQNDIFSNTPKDVPSSFPYFKPTMPPPSPSPSPSPVQNSPNLPKSPMMMQAQGGFHQGNNHRFQGNNFNSNNRGGFRGGFNNNNRGGRGNFHNRNGQGGYNNNNNNKNSNNNNTNGLGKKQQKVDKRDLPENNKFFCDTCDRGFKTEEKYKEHVDQHEQCTYKDCPFVAAPKLVQLHMNMQHRAGLAGKIYSVKSEEDIKKWKEERRRNYPTAENMKKKKEKQEERIARGEVINTKEFGKMRGQNGNRGRDGGRGGRRGGRFGRDRGHSHVKEAEPTAIVDVDDDDVPPEERKIVRSSKQEDEDRVDLTEITDSDEQHNITQQSKGNGRIDKKNAVVDLTNESKTKEKCGDEDNTDSDGSSGCDDGKDDSTAGNGDKTAKKLEEAKDGPESITIAGESEVTRSSSSVNVTDTKKDVTSVQEVATRGGQKRGHMTKGGGPVDKKPKFTPKPLPKSYTLLEKLLAKEIRRERNKILQCVHFIVKNKFFDNGNGATSE